MHTRLKQFLAAENITQAQFADRLKIGKANVSHVLSGRNKPGYDFITAIMAGFPQLNLNWLFFGSGKMYGTETPLVPDEKNSILPDPVSTLLFADFDEEDDSRLAPTAPIIEQGENLKSSDSTINIDDLLKRPVKQRVVSRIIVLFDDGTFQEL